MQQIITPNKKKKAKKQKTKFLTTKLGMKKKHFFNKFQHLGSNPP